MKNIQHLPIIILLTAHCSLLTVCSFDYGDLEPVESNMPDLVMENVDYVRVRSAQPQARFQADRAERYEQQSIMLLENVSFEQFGQTVEEVNTTGFATSAAIEIDSGNILMDNGVSIEVESEDIVLETDMLEWIDEPKKLSTGEENEVVISMSDGTSFAGIGFSADARKRTWEFTGSVNGMYIAEDKWEDEEEVAAETEEAEGIEENEEI